MAVTVTEQQAREVAEAARETEWSSLASARNCSSGTSASI